MTDLAKLIEDLEGAKSGSQELDARVAIALGWTADQAGIWLKPDGERMFWPKDTIPPSFTTNLQDAVDAVPPNTMMWSILEGGRGGCRAWIMPASAVFAERKYEVRATTPALALCIAILKAREAERD